MRTIFRRIAAAVTAAAVTLTAVVFDVPEKIAAEVEPSTCPENHSGWTAWTDTASLPTTSGSYYLVNDVTITSVKDSNASVIKNGVNVTLCLNGHTIKAQTNEVCRFFSVNGGSLTLYDCKETGKLTGAYTSGMGCAVLVWSGGTFTMYGGMISDNTAYSGGGGVYVSGNSTFKMYGGTISDNTASHTSDGGGVYVTSTGTFNMYGGTISGNTATRNGDGVYVDGTFTINGKVDITGNTLSNVYLAKDKTITIESSFDASSKIGITTITTPNCQSYVDVTAACSDVSSSFKSDNETYSVVYEGSAVKLAGPHNLTKTEAKSATCSDTGNIAYWTCSECDKLFKDENGAAETTLSAVTVAIDENAHVWGDWSVTKEPAVSSDGEITRTCTNNSSHTETAALSKLSDAEVWTKTETKQPTIDTSGTYTYTNTDHGTVTVTVPELTDTVWTKTETKQPTIDTSGTYTYTSDYGTVTVTVPKLSDTTVWTNIQHVDATEESAGKDVYNSKYGTVTVILDQLGHTHNWGNWNITKNPTFTAAGTAERTCTGNNEHKETIELPVLSDPIWTKTETQQPTIDTSGTYVYESEEYGEVTIEVPELSDETVWEKDTENSTDPTLTEKGEYVYTSEEYGEVTVEVPELSDETVWEKDAENSTDPTLTEKGEYVYTSEEYGEVTIEVPELSDETVWEKDAENSTDPTLTEKGEYVYTSEEYGEVTVEIPALSDTDIWSLDESRHVEPAEDQPGQDVYISEYGEVTVIIPPHTHTYSSEWTSDETNHWHAANCGHDVKNGEAAHTWDEGKTVKEPTANEAGEKTFKCTVCDRTKTEVIPAAGGTEEPDPDNPIPDNPDPDKPNPDKPDPDNPDPDKPDPDNPDPDKPDPDKPDPDNPDPDKPNPDNPAPDNPDPDNPDPDNPDPDKPDPDNPDPDKPDPDDPDPDNPDNGSISKEVQPGENAPDTELKTTLDELIEAVLTPEDRELVNEGVDIKIVLTVEDGTDSAPAEDKEKVETAISGLSDCKIGQYLEVNLLKIIGDEQKQITETNAPISLVFKVPEALRGEERTYSVIRVHNGETDVLSDLDSDMNTVTIETDKFSTYALVYSEKTNVTTPVGGGSGGNFTVPEGSGSGSSDTAPSESEPVDGSETADGSVSAPSGSGSADGSDPASGENKPTDGGNTLPENGGSSDNGTVSPGGEASSTNENGTNSEVGNESADNNGSMSDEGANADNNNANPSTGIAISLIPLMAVTVITAVSVKIKKK